MTGVLFGTTDVVAPSTSTDRIREHIDHTARRVDHYIDQLCPGTPDGSCAVWLPPGHTPAPDDACAQDLARRLHGALSAPVRHLTDAGGQRWRPVLVWEAIGLLGGNSEEYGPLIAAMELLHTGSLIVDDVQDASPLRRARPAAHTVFGVPAAVNAGTAAYFLTDRAIRLTCPQDPVVSGELRALFMDVLRAGHAGQALDLQGHGEEMDRAVACGDRDALLALVRTTHRLKSGSAVAAGLEAAGVVTGAAPALRGALAAFGAAVGTAYQISDDVADLQGVTWAGTATKHAAEDLRGGKVTMPLAHAVGRLPQQRLRRLWRQLRDGGGGTPEVAEACRELQACGAVTACRTEADQMVHSAWADLRRLLPSTDRCHVLHDLAVAVVQRHQVA
ncbi:heptaprenyl diphosphate synthase subunit II [Streptomyces fumigatiscleroticus]|nr:heptaprenyl diphosphate synthase subunit II [Streptomyces fumigatiscleroticus]